MFPAVAFVIALSALQPATTPATRPAPPPVSEVEPVAVPPATPTALRYYTSGNRLWVLDQVVSIVLLAVILFSGLSAKLCTWARRLGRNWFFTIVLYWTLFTILTFAITLPCFPARGHAPTDAAARTTAPTAVSRRRKSSTRLW